MFFKLKVVTPNVQRDWSLSLEALFFHRHLMMYKQTKSSAGWNHPVTPLQSLKPPGIAGIKQMGVVFLCGIAVFWWWFTEIFPCKQRKPHNPIRQHWLNCCFFLISFCQGLFCYIKDVIKGPLPKTNIAPESRPSPHRKGASSNRQFSRVSCCF